MCLFACKRCDRKCESNKIYQKCKFYYFTRAIGCLYCIPECCCLTEKDFENFD